MKIKNWIKYLIYIIVISILISLRGYLDVLLTSAYHRFNTLDMNIYGIVGLLIGLIIGLFLGLEHFISELHKKGTWKINLPKLILVGLPSLFFALTNIFFYNGSHSLLRYAAFATMILLKYTTEGLIAIFQVVFGYIIITSFYKQSEITKDEKIEY